KSAQEQVVVYYGDKHRIVSDIIVKQALSKNSQRGKNEQYFNSKDLQKFLIKNISSLLKLNENKIGIYAEFGQFGLDSITLTKLANSINGYFKLAIVPTLFYSYKNIETLSAYLVSEYPDEISAVLNTENKPQKINIPSAAFKLKDTKVSKRTPKMRKKNHNIKNEDIAIVGISGKYPGSPDLKTFWENLVKNKDLITEIPLERWDWKSMYGDSDTNAETTKAKWGGFIDDVDKFDHSFFKISPKEADLMDPQHRLCLEITWAALEDAGIVPATLSGSNTGVFIGVTGNDYYSLIQDQKIITQAHMATGVSHTMLTNRISYMLDLHGPSEVIDTACSSSLVAVHRAIESIRSGHCEVAISGGVNTILSPKVTLCLSKAGMLTEDGRCKTFDASANGYVRGEGAGIVILKTLKQAALDGDHIYGVIKGSAENHGGKASSLTAPNPDAQRDLILKAYKNADVNPEDVSYIETHGTGTSLGDPIELEGLQMAFKELSKGKYKYGSIGLGSVKTNIGHAEAAAGIAGITKVILMMQHKKIPGNVHLKEVNPYLKLDNTPFYLLKDSKNWVVDNKAIAGVSSFGFGGSNAHLIVEEYDNSPKAPVDFIPG
ncbi:beta-ketoacyl synthase N-terminal-like domain-containing protein, partial [Aquimarina aggregata]|uniref:type I polyketide synthase n=1 Tax=Aquimarina aggregata TaxID=1642818 RepID=UPI00249320FD